MVRSAQWYQSPAPVSGTFTVKWDGTTITFGTLTTPILLSEQKGTTLAIFARPNGMNLQILVDESSGHGSWTLSGTPGQASGDIARN